MAVVIAMMLRWIGDWLSPGDILKLIGRRGQLAMVMATGGHFASAVTALNEGDQRCVRCAFCEGVRVRASLTRVARLRPAGGHGGGWPTGPRARRRDGRPPARVRLFVAPAARATFRSQ
ncbi:MAG: hypothetical protein BGP17_08555 [Sphingomonas sp. 67-41]|nr:MAG: hypothetical protein BGP17_08555 [Sphingomonas sp. 67-41]